MKRKLFNEQIKENPLRSKADVKAALVDILTPAMAVLSQQKRKGRFRMSDSGAVYIQDKTEVEGFMRLLWGLGPFFADKKRIYEQPQWYELTTQAFWPALIRSPLIIGAVILAITTRSSLKWVL
ncbi:DUF2264 domain-containing protein [Lentilactobacillus kisonensis]|uniref:DUF2264 domain-containing protein n=1 Tax=Lentilactobacillus kisonensis TaxID=481722 RepID=UPI000B002269|nr:DUF2264 domain-containing protein [Lentilactobacillus kisonensis]